MFNKFELYTDLMPKLQLKPGKDVLHRQTCPVCGRHLVNIYKQGDKWKCRQCWEEVKQ